MDFEENINGFADPIITVDCELNKNSGMLLIEHKLIADLRILS